MGHKSSARLRTVITWIAPSGLLAVACGLLFSLPIRAYAPFLFSASAFVILLLCVALARLLRASNARAGKAEAVGLALASLPFACFLAAGLWFQARLDFAGVRALTEAARWFGAPGWFFFDDLWNTHLDTGSPGLYALRWFEFAATNALAWPLLLSLFARLRKSPAAQRHAVAV